MLSYPPNPALLQRLKSLDQSMVLKAQEISTLSDEEKLVLHNFARVSTIGASTRIENAVLTDPEILWIDTVLTEDGRPTAFRIQKQHIEDKLSKDKERSIEEVAGCRAMLQIIYDQAVDLKPLTEATICGLHRELLKEYPPAQHYLGKYKTQTNSVKEINHRTGEERTVLKTTDPGPMTEAAMGDLVSWYKKEMEENIWPIATASEFVFRFLAIHPFQDGNGRVGRGLFHLILMQSGEPHLAAITKYMAIDRQIERHRLEYYLSLQESSGGKFNQNPQKYHLENFTNFMVRMIDLSLRDLEINRKRYALLQNLSEKAQSVYDCFKEFPERRLSRKDILGMTRLPARTINNQLTGLIKKGLIQAQGEGSAVKYRLIF